MGFLDWVKVCSNPKYHHFVRQNYTHCELCDYPYQIDILNDSDSKISISIIRHSISEAYAALERCMYGYTDQYNTFPFVKYFKLFFKKNIRGIENQKFLSQCWIFNQQLITAYNSWTFRNPLLFDNLEFRLDCIAIMELTENLEFEFKSYGINTDFEIADLTLFKDIKIDDKILDLRNPENLEGIFYKYENCEKCLQVLRDLPRPALTNDNTYIGNSKGIIIVWLEEMLNTKPKALIKYYKPGVYQKLLNAKINGLNLPDSLSEFRIRYERAEELRDEIQFKLSQLSHWRRLRKF